MIKVKVSTIILPSAGEAYRTFYDAVAALSGGRTFVLQSEAAGRTGGVAKYLQILEAVQDIVGHSSNKFILQRYVHTLLGTP